MFGGGQLWNPITYKQKSRFSWMIVFDIVQYSEYYNIYNYNFWFYSHIV